MAKGTSKTVAAGQRSSAKRSASVKLQPVKPVAETPQPAPATAPTPDQLALWKALPDPQKLALRDREAARIFNLAVDQHRKGELADAVRNYGSSLLLNPKNPDAYNNMGVALRVLGKLEAAIACYRRCLVLRPDNAGVYSNMGNALRELGRLNLAVAAHQHALKLAPKSPEAYYNLGLALRDLGQITQALAAFERTLSYNPEHADCRWDRALTLLLKGEFLPGFQQYDWRWQLGRSPPRGLIGPEWDGSELKGKTLLIHQEQGFGDMIQFARYIPLAKARGGTIVVEVQPELSRLFATLPGIDKIINRGSPLPKYDYFVPMMSLAKVFATTIDTVPAETPYLAPPDMHAVQLPASLDQQFQIGIVWAGKSSHQNDKNRSCGFERFIELLGVPGVTVHSLQKGPRESDIVAAGCGALVNGLGSRLGDFADTACVIQQLDLVITVDTAVAHLAGALGKPVWVLLPFAPDWRWMTDRDSSPWYPDMRLFRQQKPGDWDKVFSNLRHALLEQLGHRTDDTGASATRP